MRLEQNLKEDGRKGAQWPETASHTCGKVEEGGEEAPACARGLRPISLGRPALPSPESLWQRRAGPRERAAGLGGDGWVTGPLAE